MKIKLLILESDSVYISRFVTAFQAKYADKLEVYSFTNEAEAMKTLEQAKIDVLLAGDRFDIPAQQLPRRCSFAYLVDSPDIESLRGEAAICKFQKTELIYKQILSLFAEKAGSISGLRLTDSDCKILAFLSPSGGVGSSSMAAACAVHFSALGKKVLYLNLEQLGVADAFFHAEGQFGMSDVLYALKSRKTNLALKLESCVRRDENGVYYYSRSQSALDICGLSDEEISRLISELMLAGSYELIVLDLDFALDKAHLSVYRLAHGIVLVGDGSTVSNQKLQRAVAAISILEEHADAPLTNRMFVLYNKFSNRSGAVVEELGLKSLGGAPRYEHATTQQIIAQLSRLGIFEKII